MLVIVHVGRELENRIPIVMIHHSEECVKTRVTDRSAGIS